MPQVRAAVMDDARIGMENVRRRGLFTWVAGYRAQGREVGEERIGQRKMGDVRNISSEKSSRGKGESECQLTMIAGGGGCLFKLSACEAPAVRSYRRHGPANSHANLEHAVRYIRGTMKR